MTKIIYKIIYIFCTIGLYIILGGFGSLLILVVFNLQGKLFAVLAGPILRGLIAYVGIHNSVFKTLVKHPKYSSNDLKQMKAIVIKTIAILLIIDYLVNIVIYLNFAG